jgi:lysyl-tRNA synthetase class 2
MTDRAERAITRIAQLSAHALGSALRIAGRIIAVDGEGVCLADESGVVRIISVPSASLGALLLLEVTWDGAQGVWRATLASHLPSAQEPFSEAARLLSNDRRVAKNLVLRARVFREVRDYFDRHGFLEVDTPLAVPSPGLDLHLDAVALEQRQAERFLITSPEYQMKRLLSGGLTRIYQLCRCFRHDEHGARHEPEFTMLEWYRAWSGVEAMMRDTEELVAHVARAVHGRAVVFAGAREVDVTPPWPRMTVREAFAKFAGVELQDVCSDEDRFFRLMVEVIEPALEQLGALHLYEYPIAMASLARPKPSDPSVAERFEAYVAGLELCNGFGELTDASEQRARLMRDQEARRSQGLPVYPIDERFLRALEEGMPPSGGNALGFERLVMLIAGADHIEDVLAVPSRLL